ALPEVLARVKSLFDLNARPDVIASHLADDARLGCVAATYPGLRVPGAFDGFELAVRAILGQRVSVTAATSLAGRLVGRLGEPIETPVPALHRLFPSPARLASVEELELRSLGISGARAVTISAIARAVLGRQIDLEPSPDPEAVIAKLQELPGIGDWTAQYIAMRALRWPDAFPAGDLGLLKAMGEKSVQRLRDAGEAWRPWRAYAAMYLWESQRMSNRKDHHD
ncbi:MAG TPA: AlkA N-terminal domain-containing protein, partial [Isosphaeraceae bacterium]|nr:AlkA N-terminal domain-containing protein [Isosphaeraceae bacterium]